jgi:hypothetical protein
MPLASCPVLGGDALLSTWESAAAQHPLDRALTILQAAYGGPSRDELARLPIGERDSLLFAFHAVHFGPQVEGQAHCPQCAGHVEVGLDLRALPLGEAAAPRVVRVEAEGYTVECRLPDSYDVAAVLRALLAGRSSDPRRLLFERILVAVERDGQPVDGESLPEVVHLAVADALDAAQPLADAQMLLTCPTCGHVWSLVLDIVDFVWARLEALALRLLGEVDALARAYGWRETDILALSPARRHAYLGMVAG